MESFLVVSRTSASSRFLKHSYPLSRTIFAPSSYHPTSTSTTTATSNPIPYRYPNARRLGSFSQRHRRDTCSRVGFDHRLGSHMSSSSSTSTAAKRGANQTISMDNDKVEGTWIDLSTTVAANPGQLPDIKILTLLGFGALFSRGAGYTTI
ncbi:hypothetical protein ACFX13_006433 [Malus domestica]